jgi:hypothetical protein
MELPMQNASHRYKLLESGKVAAPIQRGLHAEICDAICHEAEAADELLSVEVFRARANAHIHALKAAKAA